MCGITVIVGRNKEEALAMGRRFQVELNRRGPDGGSMICLDRGNFFVVIVAAVLHIRGNTMCQQPVVDKGTGDVLAWNGELYDCAENAAAMSDTLVLMDRLAKDSAERVFSQAEGPFSAVYFHVQSNSLYFCRNLFGQRSLLVSLPHELEGANITNEADHCIGSGALNMAEMPLIISSVALKDVTQRWQEVPCDGVFRVTNLERLEMCCAYTPLPRTAVVGLEEGIAHTRVWNLLLAAARKRCTTLGDGGNVIRVLFSGGVDSVLVAVALHLNLPLADTRIVLVNVSFADNAPDRLQARRAHLELQRLFGERKWELLDVPCSGDDAMNELEQVRRCIYPNENVMDVTIATVLWFGCRTEIVVKGNERMNKVMFTGLGADELFAGYARHVGKWKHVGNDGLSEELRNEILRIGYRNNGRDDRVAGHWSLETRHLFLDRDLVNFALATPLAHFADLTLTDRQGGKLVLREILRVNLGFSREIWDAPKKAMQFGSRMNHVFRSVFGKANGQDKVDEL